MLQALADRLADRDRVRNLGSAIAPGRTVDRAVRVGGPARWSDVGIARGDADSRRHRRHPFRRTHQCRRRASPAGGRNRRRLRQTRRPLADEPGPAARHR